MQAEALRIHLRSGPVIFWSRSATVSMKGWALAARLRAAGISASGPVAAQMGKQMQAASRQEPGSRVYRRG